MKVLWIALAGAAGALSRYALTGVIAGRTKGAFPWGTLVVNVSGSFVLGLLFVVMTERFLPSPTLRAAVTVGFLGAFTTFSTFALESLQLADEGAVGLALLNIGGSVVAGLAAVALGTWVGRAV